MAESNAHDLFLHLLDLPEGERSAFLDAECSSPELRIEVEGLLAALGDAEGFLEESGSTAASLEEAGMVIAGRYRLLEEIGEGGFGVVWMADQIEPVRRKVALKVLKAGMDTRSVVARFTAERQALALMDHPNIARVYDAGSTESGRPYFVMELVQGVPITKFCDGAELDIRARLELFIQVCLAVEHAHQKGIVHRDLKPGNLLVGTVDGQPAARVIDFGVAKAIRSDELTQLTLFTGFRQAVGTPEYMAPEQTGLSMVDVDTRADVYALGVVLYELLTGKKPFSLKDSASSGAGYQEFLRRVREVEPPKPSTNATAGEESQVRGLGTTGAARLGRMLRGDLDWIVIKALQKERDRRYPTASALAADIQRHLDGRVVDAGPPSYRYRLRRFAGQHRIALAFVGVVFVALLATVIATTLALNRALAAEAESNADAKRTRTALSAMRRFIGDVNPHSPLGPDRTLRELLDQRGPALIAATATEPAIEADVRATIGSAYRAMGALGPAREHLERAVEIHRRHGSADHRGMADALWHMASLLHDEGQFEEAMRVIDESFELIASVEVPNEVELAQRRYLKADLLRHVGRHDEALAAAQPAIDTFSQCDSENLSLALSLNVPGMVAMDRGEFRTAEPFFRRSLLEARAAEPAGGLVTCTCLVNLGTALLVQGKAADAEPCFQEALTLYRELLSDKTPRLLSAMEGLAIAFERQGQHDKARPLIVEAIEIRRETGLLKSLSYVRSVTRLGNQLSRENAHHEAVESYLEALGALDAMLGGQDNSESAMIASYAARELLDASRADEALPLIRRSLAWHDANRPDAWQAWVARSVLGGCLAATGNDEEGELLLSEAFEKLDPPASQWTRRIEALDRLIVFHRDRAADPEHAKLEQEMRAHREQLVKSRSIADGDK